MVLLLDAEIRPARPGLLSVCAYVPDPADQSDLTGLRVLLVADLLTRAAELRRLQVLTALTAEGPTEPLERTARALGIHPPAARAKPGEAAAALSGPIDVLLTGDGTTPDEATLVALVGTARGDQGGDPLALRLALLGVPWHQPTEVTADTLDDAGQTLYHWRRRVAEWARSPSGPMPPPVARQVRAAIDALDTVAALALLRDLAADDTASPDTRFETFLYVDRLLGLELPRDIGRDQ